MVIGGLQKHSLIDYPGKISCVVFLAGCNFDCPYCHNPDLVRGTPSDGQRLAVEAVFDFLERRRGFLEAVVVSGGEPCLQPDLPAFCRRVKALGYPLKLDTNGSRPNTLQRLLDEGLIDYLAMDVKADPRRYPEAIGPRRDCARIPQSIRLILASGVPHEFRTTCVRPFVDADAVARIARSIDGADLYALQRFHGTHVLHPEFFDSRVPGFSDRDLEALRTLAAPHVHRCIVR